jgi:hypothetical protein
MIRKGVEEGGLWPISELQTDISSAWPEKARDCFSHNMTVVYPGILFRGGGFKNSVEDRGQRERGSGGGSPLLMRSGGNCNLVQEISFHKVKFS